MNEIYLSVIEGQGSDHIFVNKHLDGPFFFLPYCYVYRCILGLSNNPTIFTHFIAPHYPTQNGKREPSSQKNNKIEIQSKNIDIYEYIAFDYNRDIHYIDTIGGEPKTPTTKYVPPNDKNAPRVVYKLHYIICPSFVPSFVVGFYKYLHISYNNTMRFLFVNSQKNDSYLSRMIMTGNSWFLYCFQTMFS